MPLFPVVNRTTGSETTLAPSVAAVASALTGKLSTTGNGSGLTGLTQSQISGLVDALAAKLASNGNGSSLTGLTVSQLSDASANGKSLISAADFAAMRTLLGLVIGTDVLAPNGNGSALTGLTQSQISGLVDALAAKLASNGNGSSLTGLTVSQLSDASANGKSLISAADYAAMRILLGLVIGTDVLSPTGNGSGLTNLNASSLATGTVPAARLGSGTADSTTILYGDNVFRTAPGGAAFESVWASDTVEAFTGGVYKAILTTSSLAVGCYEVTAIINTRRATAATVGTRWIAGTASLAGASGDALGHAMLEGSTITQITLSSTSPWTTSQAARFSSADGATHMWRLALDVTSAGTVSLQMYLNATNNVTIEKGSIVTFRKVS